MTTRAALFAALPMYDFAEVAWANDAFWRGMAERLRAVGVDAPLGLTRSGEIEAEWRYPNLLFGQTCGYPYRKALQETVTLIATPEYAFPGCEGLTHCSFVIRRADDRRRELVAFRGSVAAINCQNSNSGMNLFRAVIAPIAMGASFFAKVVATGSHVASLRAVAAGAADLAAVDCVSFALIAREEPRLSEQIATVARTASSPCLPFIASSQLPRETLAAVRHALFAAIADPKLADALSAIGLKGVRDASPADYRPVLDMERAAESCGYARLC